MRVTRVAPIALLSLLFAGVLFAAADTALRAELREAGVDGEHAVHGVVTFVDSPYGLLIRPELHGLQPGPHAAHLHEHGDCSPGPDGTPAGAAGGHYDPQRTGLHAGPYAPGHLGDLPNLFVEADGRARVPLLAPRARVADLGGRALMIHAGADRYDAHGHHAHGKGGARMYCGVIR